MDTRPHCRSCRVPTTWPPQAACDTRAIHYGHPRPLNGLAAMVHDLVAASELRKSVPVNG